MAEWSIAPVLKTDVLRGTGGSNPSLSARNKRTEVLLFCFIASRELAHGLDREQNKENAAAFLFLAKEPMKGMDKQSEVNPDQASRELAHGLDREQNKENAAAFLFLAKEPMKGMDKQSEVNPDQASRELAHGLDREQKAQRKKLRDFIFRTPLRNQKPTFQSSHNETASITRREQPQRGLRPMDVIADAYGNAHKDIRHNTCCKEKPTERA